MITQDTIQQIISRIDILEVVGGFVKLKKRGTNYLGLCPFHNEKSPSFTVSPAKEIFKCFGCGKSGNTISFIMEHEKLSYVEALRWLAQKYNVTIEETERSPEQIAHQQQADSLYIINDFASKFYSSQLLETEDGRAIGLSYLHERGFTDEIIQKFQLGYAPEHRNVLATEAVSRQFNPELLQKAGLVIERNGNLVDNYRDRIIFPIHGTTGKVIGFGARLIRKNDRAPKYINTPENELYIKSRILYGSYFARHAIDKLDECYLVEGYTDVISLHQAGIENVVASGGTSLTPDQLRLIKKYTKNLTIIYDGDSAGIKAALRGLDLAIEEGLNVQLVLIPDGEDPDSYVRKVGGAAFRDFVSTHKKDFVFFQIDVGLKDAGDDARKKTELVNQLAETISRIDRTADFVRQQDYIRRSSSLLGIDEAGLTNLVNKFIRNRLAKGPDPLPFDEAQVHMERAAAGEKTDFDDQTFNLLFKEDLQEREMARVLLELGERKYDEEHLVSDYIFTEFTDDEHLENAAVLKLVHLYRSFYQPQKAVDRNIFLYHADPDISTLAVALLHFPYEESTHWKKELSASSGYQKSLFEQDYRGFLDTLKEQNADKLMDYLKIQRDNTFEQVNSAVNYLKLRKVHRMMIENQKDLEKVKDDAELTILLSTHNYLKQQEIELTRKLGTVVIK